MRPPRASDSLDESTKTLNLTQTLYDNYSSLLNTSGQLVKAIEKADWYDRLLIFAAFSFFLLVVGWVIKRRVLDKVAGGVWWWVGGSWKLVMLGIGRGKSKGVATVASSAVTSASTLASVVSAARNSGASKAKSGPTQPKSPTATEAEGTTLDSIVPTDNPSSAVAKPSAQVKDEL
jgi:protein transport protein SEC20